MTIENNRIVDRARGLARFINDDDDVSEAQTLMRDVMSLIETTALATSNDRVSKYISRAGMAVSVGAVFKSCYKMYKKTRREPEDMHYFIKIDESDDLFEIAEAWAMEAMPEESQRSVIAYTDTDSDSEVSYRRNSRGRVVADINENPVTLGVAYDGSVLQSIEVRGHTVDIQVETPEMDFKAMSMGNHHNNAKYRTITITCTSLKAKNAVLDELREIASMMHRSQPTFNINAKWGGFSRRSSAIPARPQESVILKEGQMDRILNYLDEFLQNEKPYTDLGLPYRTGILLHGNPGSGKTSTATAIAYELGLDVYYIALSSVDSDSALNSLMEDVPSRSVLILEDIDIADATRSRDKSETKETPKITLQGLLNALDGFVSPHGVITIMTTNKLDELDEALIRSGRVDLKEEVDELDSHQLAGICNYFMKKVPENLPEVFPKHKITSADVIGVMRNHIPNIENAEKDLLEFVTKKVAKYDKKVDNFTNS